MLAIFTNRKLRINSDFPAACCAPARLYTARNALEALNKSATKASRCALSALRRLRGKPARSWRHDTNDTNNNSMYTELISAVRHVITTGDNIAAVFPTKQLFLCPGCCCCCCCCSGRTDVAMWRLCHALSIRLAATAHRVARRWCDVTRPPS